MPTTTRIDKDPNNRLDASFMNNFHEEVDVERRLMLYCQHHRNCNTKYQDTIAYRRLAEDQKSKALLDKFKDSSKKDAINLSQDKSSKPKASTVKPEQQQASSDHSKSQQASLPESNKVLNLQSCMLVASVGLPPSSKGIECHHLLTMPDL